MYILKVLRDTKIPKQTLVILTDSVEFISQLSSYPSMYVAS
jgi:hypothetical protein